MKLATEITPLKTAIALAASHATSACNRSRIEDMKLQFSIRDIIWATLVVAIICGWVANSLFWLALADARDTHRFQQMNLLYHENHWLRREVASLKEQIAAANGDELGSSAAIPENQISN